MGRAIIDRSIRVLEAGGQTLDVTVVSVGNPHCVIFGQPLTRERLLAIGPLVERHPKFPDRTNVQLAQAESRDRARMLVWERGAGHTLASGTSASAVAAACFDRGLVDGALVVEMEGGQLELEVGSDLGIVMTGPVEEVFLGTLSPDLRQRLLEMQ
jgi:diaminopimelate epimerase